jgi:hypothetical protein
MGHSIDWALSPTMMERVLTHINRNNRNTLFPKLLQPLGAKAGWAVHVLLVDDRDRRR